MSLINLCQLKSNFSDIKHLRESVLTLLTSLTEKADILNCIYTDLLESNINETTTGLDSFFFQIKLLYTEINNNKTMFKIIDNRFYCDYYKLYKIFVKYLKEIVNNKNITSPFDNKQYPVYKDLNFNNIIEYDFNNTIEIYNDLIQILDILHNELLSREHKLGIQKVKQQSGLNIDNLVNKIKYNNSSLKNNLKLFSGYIKICNNFHTRYLTRFSIKTKLFYGQINSDIRIEESKSGINCNVELNNDILLDETEENEIRNCIPEDSVLKGKIQSNTQDNLVNELNSMIQNISDNISEPNSSKSELGVSIYNEESEKSSIYNYPATSSLDKSAKIIQCRYRNFKRRPTKILKKNKVEKEQITDECLEYPIKLLASNCIIF